MSIKIMFENQVPNQKMRSSYVQGFPEWDEALNALATLPPGKVVEVTLSDASLSKIGTAKNKESYFGQQLRIWFKNARIPATAWAKQGKVYIRRTVPAAHGRQEKAS
jgi:hypothetical protein